MESLLGISNSLGARRRRRRGRCVWREAVEIDLGLVDLGCFGRAGLEGGDVVGGEEVGAWLVVMGGTFREGWLRWVGALEAVVFGRLAVVVFGAG